MRTLREMVAAERAEELERARARVMRLEAMSDEEYLSDVGVTVCARECTPQLLELVYGSGFLVDHHARIQWRTDKPGMQIHCDNREWYGRGALDEWIGA